MKRIIFITVFCLFTFIITGCQVIEQNVKQDQQVMEAKIENTANFKFEDLPIPNNLGIISDDSFVYETENYRTGILKYIGKDDCKNIGNFFKGELPKYNWTLVSSIEFKKSVQLVFEKPGWINVIYIEQNGSDVSLTITIGPKTLTTKSK